jgi:diguanylate cyclase (GGDEF)-like protein
MAQLRFGPALALLVLCWGAIAGIHAEPALPSDAPVLVDGTIDLREFDPDAREPIPLDGEWLWFPDQLLTAANGVPDSPSTLELPISLPPEDSRGTGTLVATILPPPGSGLYSLKIPYLASANRVYINGEYLGGSGSVTDPYRPQYLPLEISFPSDGRPILVALQVANEHHRRMRLNRIYFGTSRQITHYTDLRLIADAILLGSLALLALYHLLAFSLHRRDREFLFFAAIAALAAFRLGIARERILVRLWTEMPAELMMKLGYAPVFLLLPLVILYLNALSPYDSLRRTARIARGVGLAFLALIILTPVAVYDWVFTYGLMIIVALAISLIVTIFRRRVFESRQGTVVIALGGSLVIAGGVSDYFREIGTYDAPELLSPAIVFFLLLQAYFLAWRFRVAYRDIKRMAGEIRRLNQDLELRITDRTEALAEANEQLRKISRTDPLTGLANRRSLDEALEREWLLGARRGTPVAAIMADIDHFKAYNDSLGHPRGDECLRRISEILSGGARRPGDLVTRYGGEEFAILLPETSLEAAATVAEMLRRQIEEEALPHGASPTAPIVTISMGAASLVPTADGSASSLIKAADVALYRAKALGRNRVERAE